MSGKRYDFSKFAKDADPAKEKERARLQKLITMTKESLKRPMGHVPRGREMDDLRKLERQLAALGDDELATDPPVSQNQREAMFSAKAGKSNLGIPQKVGAEFAKADPGGKLPARKR